MIQRPHALNRVRSVFEVHPIAALLGPRQCNDGSEMYNCLLRKFIAP